MTNKISFNMDKVKAGVTIFGMVLTITLTTKAAHAGSASPNVVLNGSELALSQSSIIQDGTTLVTVRDICTELGADVQWDPSAETFTAVKDDITITIKIGSNILTRNGEEITLDVPAQLVDDKAMVPLRAVAENLGVEVNWDAKTMTASMNEKK